MGNIFKEVAHRVGDLVSYPVKIGKDLVTHPSKGWNELTHLYTHNEHKDQDLFQKGFGIHGWVGKHPQETAAAVVATIFGGWAAAGAYGGAGAGAAGAGAAGSSGALAGGGSALAGSGAGAAGYGTAATSAGSLFNSGVAGTLGSSAGGTMSAAGAGGSASFGVGATSAGSVFNASAGYTGVAGSGSGYLGSASATGSGWFENAQTAYKRYNQLKQMTNQGGSQEQQQFGQPQAPQSQNLLGAYQGAGNSGQNTATPQTTSQLLGNNSQFNGTGFKNQFGG